MTENEGAKNKANRFALNSTFVKIKGIEKSGKPAAVNENESFDKDEETAESILKIELEL